MMFGKVRTALVLAFLLAASACHSRTTGPHSIRVFAAASLGAPISAIAKVFEAQHPDLRVELNFAGSATLLTQLREGAVADLLATADEQSMATVATWDLTSGSPRIFAQNQLAIVVRKGNPKGITALKDLARSDLAVGLCGPEVPAGRYAREALETAKVTVHPRTLETSVQALVGKVSLGELDAGIAYRTDANRDSVAAVAIPNAHNVTVHYLIATLSHGLQRSGADAFCAMVLSKEGQDLLHAHGFLAP